MCPENLEYRQPSEDERELLELLLAEPFEGRDGLRAQADSLTVKPIDENGSLRMLTSDPTLANVGRRIPVEGTYLDSDGVAVHVLVHVINGALNELEIYRDDSGKVIIAAADAKKIVVESA